jgi:hypothetical protein
MSIIQIYLLFLLSTLIVTNIKWYSEYFKNNFKIFVLFYFLLNLVIFFIEYFNFKNLENLIYIGVFSIMNTLVLSITLTNNNPELLNVKILAIIKKIIYILVFSVVLCYLISSRIN